MVPRDSAGYEYQETCTYELWRVVWVFLPHFAGVRRRGDPFERGFLADPCGWLSIRELGGVFESHECQKLNLKLSPLQNAPSLDV